MHAPFGSVFREAKGSEHASLHTSTVRTRTNNLHRGPRRRPIRNLMRTMHDSTMRMSEIVSGSFPSDRSSCCATLSSHKPKALLVDKSQTYLKFELRDIYLDKHQQGESAKDQYEPVEQFQKLIIQTWHDPCPPRYFDNPVGNVQAQESIV